MKKIITIALFCSLIACTGKGKKETGETGKKVHLITLAPGHFHAALVQKTSYPQVSDRVSVYAPDGEEVREHLKRIESYNQRTDMPTRWDETLYTGSDFLERMKADTVGNVVVIAGNNRDKTVYIKASLDAGKNVLADKPMAINTENFELLKECFTVAESKGLLLYDIMTERFEITSILQKEFSQLPGLFGRLEKGTPQHPAIVKESVHHFAKQVSGKPLTRPAWFFDVEQEGDGMVDVGTHLVDLVQWACFPEQTIDYTTDIEIIDANRYPTPLTLEQFSQVATPTIPGYLDKYIENGMLNVYANGDITYRLKDIYARVSVIWNYKAPEGGGDTHFSVMRGTKANLIIRQDAEQNFVPMLYIESRSGGLEARVHEAVGTLSKKYEGIAAEKIDEGCWKVIIPDKYHVGHEAHFGQVTGRFLEYLGRGELPAWEVPNMIAKYYTTTQALRFAMNKNLK